MTTASAPGPSPATSATKFEPVPNWAKLPMGVSFSSDATSVAVDSQDNVYVFNRGTDPIAVFDPDGNFIRGMAHGEIERAHGIAIDVDDNIYLVDELGHFVQKRTNDGVVVFTIGTTGMPAPWQSGEMFNRPTDITVNPATGDLFVSDGYANSRVHKFDQDGKHIKSWGESGADPGQFSIPHNICMIGTDRVAVCDRENFRVQVFTTEGEYVDQWHLHHPACITEGRGDDTNLYVGEMGPPTVQNFVPNLGNRVVVMSPDGEMVSHFGSPVAGEGPDQFIAPHGIATDSQGNVYVAEVSWSFWWRLQDNPPIGESVSLRKWRRTGD